MWRAPDLCNRCPPLSFMKIKPTTSLNDAIKRIAEGNIGAAMVLAMLLRDHPDTILKWIREMDRIGLRGKDIWVQFDNRRQDMNTFLIALNDGGVESDLKELNRSRGVK